MRPGYIWQTRYKNVGFTKYVAVFMDQVEFWLPLPTLTQFVKREQLILMHIREQRDTPVLKVYAHVRGPSKFGGTKKLMDLKTY